MRIGMSAVNGSRVKFSRRRGQPTPKTVECETSKQTRKGACTKMSTFRDQVRVPKVREYFELTRQRENVGILKEPSFCQTQATSTFVSPTF